MDKISTTVLLLALNAANKDVKGIVTYAKEIIPPEDLGDFEAIIKDAIEMGDV